MDRFENSARQRKELDRGTLRHTVVLICEDLSWTVLGGNWAIPVCWTPHGSSLCSSLWAHLHVVMMLRFMSLS